MGTNRTKRAALVLLVTAPLALGLSSCGKAVEKVSEKAAEKSIEKASGGDAKVDLGKDEVNIKTKDGTMSYGAKLPENWPSDIPLPKDFEIVGGSDLSEGSDVMMSVGGTTSMSADDVVSFYADKMSGWEKEGELNMGDAKQNRTVSYKKDNLMFILGVSEENGETQVSLSYTSSGDDN